MKMSEDKRTTRQIDDEVMNALLQLVHVIALNNYSRPFDLQPHIDVIKDGVAELVRRVEAAE